MAHSVVLTVIETERNLSTSASSADLSERLSSDPVTHLHASSVASGAPSSSDGLPPSIDSASLHRSVPTSSTLSGLMAPVMDSSSYQTSSFQQIFGALTACVTSTLATTSTLSTATSSLNDGDHHHLSPSSSASSESTSAFTTAAAKVPPRELIRPIAPQHTVPNDAPVHAFLPPAGFLRTKDGVSALYANGSSTDLATLKTTKKKASKPRRSLLVGSSNQQSDPSPPVARLRKRPRSVNPHTMAKKVGPKKQKMHQALIALSTDAGCPTVVSACMVCGWYHTVFASDPRHFGLSSCRHVYGTPPTEHILSTFMALFSFLIKTQQLCVQKYRLFSLQNCLRRLVPVRTTRRLGILSTGTAGKADNHNQQYLQAMYHQLATASLLGSYLL